jgi:hypothetical protein
LKLDVDFGEANVQDEVYSNRLSESGKKLKTKEVISFEFQPHLVQMLQVSF